MIETLELFDHQDNEIVTFTHDPIAIALLRSESESPVMMNTIDKDSGTSEIITNGEYIKNANLIREYYKKRLFFGAMNDKFRKTDFRDDLQEYIEREDIYTVNASEIGMIARLPDFYQEDITRDKLHKECTGNKPSETNFWADDISVEYLTKTQTRHGRKKQYCYWFKKQDRALCFYIEGNNPLVSLLDNYLKSNKIIRLQGGFNTRVQDGFHFYIGNCKVLV